MNIKLIRVFAAVLSVFLFSGHVYAEKSIQEEIDEQVEECRHFDKLACELVMPKLNAMKTPLAGELSVELCLNRDEMCDNALWKAAPAVQKTLVDHIYQVCMKTGAEMCSSLASHLVEKGQYAKAIAAAQKQYAKTKNGIYGFYESKYGNREKGLKAAEADCLNKRDRCGFYLVNLKPNKATPVFLKGTLEQCKNRNEVIYGSDECVLAALYYYRNNEATQAVRVLMTSCERGNPKACVYTMALQPRQAQALRLYCKVDDSGPRQPATENRFSMFPANENWLDCKGVNSETQTISPQNILRSSEDLKQLVNAFGNPS